MDWLMIVGVIVGFGAGWYAGNLVMDWLDLP